MNVSSGANVDDVAGSVLLLVSLPVEVAFADSDVTLSDVLELVALPLLDVVLGAGVGGAGVGAGVGAAVGHDVAPVMSSGNTLGHGNVS